MTQTESLTLPASMEPDNPLWRYALACWQKPHVAEACLSLQDQGWSVTRILCAGWLGVNRRAFTGIEDATVTEWREHVTGRIRSARKTIPRHHAPTHDLRSALAEAELQAEQTELALAWQTLYERNPEVASMQTCTSLIVQNLLSAAPLTTRELQSMTQITKLAELLAEHSRRSSEPC
ncbi:TIGR02444 family protein [Marinobacter litoralis]|uniref:TIGR02444 family protein n=1 Tax=Marinobacter litoralis TaxID=187981 RepID=UPI001D114485|nr:TIGR02444 family protein [Marinobacter litoralis]